MNAIQSGKQRRKDLTFAESKHPVPMARTKSLYLLVYNAAQACGWSYSLFRILANVALTKSIHGSYASASSWISFLQLLAVLEVVHAATGLTPAKVMPALQQWGGRIHFLFAIVCKIPEVQELPSVFITFTAWSLSEVIRYSHYTMNCIDVCPYWLTYLRYTSFILLYPVGVFPGEMWLMYQALPFIKKENLYQATFSRLHLTYHAFVVVLLVFYPFLWFNLYMYLFRQRLSRLCKIPQARKRQ